MFGYMMLGLVTRWLDTDVGRTRTLEGKYNMVRKVTQKKMYSSQDMVEHKVVKLCLTAQGDENWSKWKTRKYGIVHSVELKVAGESCAYLFV